MITVVGLGEVGIETFRELNKNKVDVYGVDINDNLLKNLQSQGFNVGKEILKSDTYIVAVYLTEQVFDVLKKLDYSNNPLVVIESTVMPGTYKKIIDWKKKNNFRFDVVLFPHRFNPQDSEHHVFNLDRAIGGEDLPVKRAINFYEKFMPDNLIHKTTPEIAELTKPVENAYRFVEIAIAQDIRLVCEQQGIDFNELRKIANTKWNIDIKEARDGIGGKCLPKDIDLIDKFFPRNTMFKAAIQVNEKYKEVISNASLFPESST